VKVPYSNNQIIATTFRILVTSNMFLLKEFDAWELTANMTYPALKTFFYEAYGRCLTASELRSMSGQNGYASQMIYNLMEGDDDTDNNMVRTTTQTAAVAVASTMATASGTSGITSNAYSLTINTENAAAINQLLVNQTTIMTQMVALSFAQEPAQHTRWLLQGTLSRCHLSNNLPSRCSNLLFRRAHSTRIVEYVRAGAIGVAGVEDGVIPCFPITCTTQVP
jgi:hypothetical protein